MYNVCMTTCEKSPRQEFVQSFVQLVVQGIFEGIKQSNDHYKDRGVTISVPEFIDFEMSIPEPTVYNNPTITQSVKFSVCVDTIYKEVLPDKDEK